MERNTRTTRYVIELTGDVHSHARLTDTVEEMDDAEIVAQEDTEGYFEVDDAQE